MLHKMMLEKTYQSGNEVWDCEQCGRRLMISWEPEFAVIVIESGNESAAHSGSTGGLRIGTVEITK